MSDPEEPNLDDLIDAHKPPSHPETGPVQWNPPKGWQPGVSIKEDGSGEAVMQVDPGEVPDWDPFLKEMGFGDVLEFVRVVDARSWEVFSKQGVRDPDTGEWGPGKVTLRYVKCKIVRRMSASDQNDLDELKERILTLDPGPMQVTYTGEHTMMLLLSDWQFGKREGGGSAATVERILSCVRQFLVHVTQLRALGISIGKLVLCGLGDMVEACDGHYPMQAFQVDLHMRAQRAVTRRVLIQIAKMVRPFFLEIDFRAIPGNHGEERKNGKAFTSFSDNNDVCIFDQLRDVLAEADWAEGINVYTTSMAEPEITMSFEVEGTDKTVRVGLAHGHQARGGPNKVMAWWAKCADARHAMGYVDILNTGHYHHFRCEDRGSRKTWFQAPTLDGGSAWFREQGGSATAPGMLTYLINADAPSGWDWARVLTP